MPSGSILYDQYINQSNRSSEPISPLRAAIDPRFSILLKRAEDNQERASQQKISSTNWVHSPSVITVNSNSWSPKETTEEKPKNTEKKNCLSPVWRSCLLGLLIGLMIAAISTGITLGVLLTRSSTNSITATTTSACSSFQWDTIGITVAGNGTYGSAPSELRYPWGVYVDSNNAIYVADYYNQRIQKWLPNAVSGTTVAGVTGIAGTNNNSLLYYPRTVYGDAQQNLYIGDNYGISKWSLGASTGSRIANSSGIGTILGIFVDSSGNVYVSTQSPCVIRMWTPTATASTIVAGGSTCSPSSSLLDYPYGFFVDSSTSTIFISNSNSHTIVTWPVGGTTGTVVAGLNYTSGSINSLLNYPEDVKSDQYGNLYVADTDNRRVLLFCQNPPSTTAAIIAGYELSNPSSIALDSNLNLYVTDMYNYRVLKFTRIV